MAKSKLIADLISGKITITQTLERLLVIAMELNDTETVNWIKSELYGYQKEDDIPTYRVIELLPMGTYQFVGYGMLNTCSNQMLPTLGVPEQVLEKWKNSKLRLSISQVLDMKNKIDNGTNMGNPLGPETFSWFEEGTNLTVTSAQLVMPVSSLQAISDSVKQRILEILVLMDKNFGCLDELDIDCSNYEPQEISAVKDLCKTAIAGQPITNIYVINAKVKNSNIGQGNSSEKTTTTEVNSSISIEKGDAVPWWKKIFKCNRGKR